MTDAGTGHHPPEDELASYQAGELSPEAEERIQEHLLRCRECTDLLLALDGLHHPEQAAPVPAGELAAMWDGLQAKLPPRKETLAPAPLPFSPRVAPKPPRWLQALAASLAAAVLGLSLWAVSLRRTVDELSAPQLNTPVEDLFPAPLRDGQGGPAVVELAPEARSFTLVLTPAVEGRFAEHEVEIARADGPVVWRGRGLRPNRYGSFSLTLPRRLVGVGEYRVQLFGIENGARQEVGTYRLSVR